MWNFFSKDPSKDLVNFELQEQIQIDHELQDKSIWYLNNAKKKGSIALPGVANAANSGPNDLLFSVFSCQVKPASENWLSVAKNGYKRMKMLRHPNILMFQDGVDSDKAVYIVTERVQPLHNYLKESKDNESQKENEISWGLYSIATALNFLNQDCKLVHNNVCMSSIVVNKAGEWKLTGFEYTHSIDDQNVPLKVLPSLDRYEPPEKSPITNLKASPNRNQIQTESGVDSWMFGCLIWEIFNGILPNMNALKNSGNIPKKLLPAFMELINASPSRRLSPAKFLAMCTQQNGFMNNHFVDTLLFLEQIQIKDQTEKQKFFSELTQKLDDFPRQLCLFKILPQLLTAYEFGNAGSTVLPPLFKLGKMLDETEYQKKIVPIVVKLFSLTDRATRMRLLQQLHLFVEHLSASIINEQIFPHLCLGFSDTNPAIRESTIRAIVLIAPKLNYNNLNIELMKHFARLQAQDDQGMIRTNTTVCIGKIANYINPQLRQRILLSAFPKAMRDPFPLARLSGIVALANTDRFYTLKDVATKVLPSLCMLTIDPEKDVRDEAFKTIKKYMEKLEKVSEQPEKALEFEKDVESCALDLKNETSWTSWAMNSLSNKMSNYKNKEKQPSVALNTQPLGPPPSLTSSAAKSQNETKNLDEQHKSSQQQSSNMKKEVKEEKSDFKAASNNQGWAFDDQDEWKDLEDEEEQMEPLEPLEPSYANAKTNPTNSSNKNSDWSNEWSNSFEPETNTNNNKSSLPSTSSYNWSQYTIKDEEDLFSSLVKDVSIANKNQSKPSVQSSALGSKSSASSMQANDWSNDWDSFENNSNSSQNNAKRTERQQRNAEKQAENASKLKAGPLKLGQKKTNPDFF